MNKDLRTDKHGEMEEYDNMGGVFSVGKFLLTTIFTPILDISIKFSGGEAYGRHKK